MENTSKLDADNLTNLFIDVRNSYRFLYNYQKRVMDLVSFIGHRWNFKFESGESNFCNPPSNWKNIDPNKHWSWDFLLLYNYVFVFNAKSFNKWKNLRLMINIVSDTGFYDNDNEIRTRTEYFESVNNSKTQLHMDLPQLSRQL